jgi:hypothetical protein
MIERRTKLSDEENRNETDSDNEPENEDPATADNPRYIWRHGCWLGVAVVALLLGLS